MPNARTFDIEVVQHIRVTLDAAKFDEAFMSEFREGFYPFTSLEDHASHIAQLQARGLIDTAFDKCTFIEGYGPANQMGIAAEQIAQMDSVLPPEVLA